MCGRFTITLPADEVHEQLELGSMPGDWRPRYNAAPSQPVAVVSDASTRNVEWMRWGLIPSWAKDMDIGNRLINARAETVMEKPSFRQAFNRRRCILLADGFYEWQHLEEKKSRSIPYFFRRKDSAVFGFAGLWETWRSPAGDEIRSCTILTTSANGVVKPIHDRMPVMLSGDAIWTWILDGKPEDHMALLKPYPEDWMERYQVSRAVNDPAQDTPDVVLPAAG
jgi:putative SOS response-associated peptidase YedK